MTRTLLKPQDLFASTQYIRTHQVSKEAHHIFPFIRLQAYHTNIYTKYISKNLHTPLNLVSENKSFLFVYNLHIIIILKYFSIFQKLKQIQQPSYKFGTMLLLYSVVIFKVVFISIDILFSCRHEVFAIARRIMAHTDTR